jgi:hypothetical protein
VNGTGVNPEDLVGRWRKVDDGGSATPFPQEIEFFADRTYRGTGDGVRRPVWDEASYDVLTDGSVRIQTAHDRKVTYSASHAGARLTLAAGNDRVTYHRMPPHPSGPTGGAGDP